MPHLIIEHSSNIQSNSIRSLQRSIQDIMDNSEGNFDSDQCKTRALSFNDYFVGRIDQSDSSFIHITLKALAGRSLEHRQTLSQKIMAFTKEFFLTLDLNNKRCDISVDIVEMDKETYQKWRKED